MTQRIAEVAWAAADAVVVGAIEAARKRAETPIVVGLAGAQGSGKSTMAPRLVAGLAGIRLRAAVLSLDDFYLTRAERSELARTVHPLLGTRGVPGTHDLALLDAALDALLFGAGEVRVPRFDKSADDRVSPPEWTGLVAPVDVVVLEGWCVGARPQPGSGLVEPVNALEREEDADGLWRRCVNARLASDYAKLFERLSLKVFLRAPDFSVVERWRAEQEARLSQPGMTAAELGRFVAHYERITRWMIDDRPADLVIDLDAARTPST